MPKSAGKRTRTSRVPPLSRARVRGIVHGRPGSGPLAPPRIVDSPWYNLELGFSAQSSATSLSTLLSTDDLAVALTSQLGVAPTTGNMLQFRIERVRCWADAYDQADSTTRVGTVLDMQPRSLFASFSDTSANFDGNELQIVRGSSSNARSARCMYVWPQVHQANVLNSSATAGRVIVDFSVNVLGVAPTTPRIVLYVYVRVLWKTRTVSSSREGSNIMVPIGSTRLNRPEEPMEIIEEKEDGARDFNQLRGLWVDRSGRSVGPASKSSGEGEAAATTQRMRAH